MAPRSRLAIPTNLPLPHTHRLPSASRDVFKILHRLSRPALINLALDWLKSSNKSNCMPYLQAYADEQDNDNAPYLPAHNIEEVREIYEELQARRGSKREVIDRILEGDWRHGLTLYQLATADIQYLVDHPTAQRWTALRLNKLKSSASDETSFSSSNTTTAPNLPRFHAPTFLSNLQREISPITKAHYHLTRPSDPSLPLTFLRIYVHDSPYNTQRSLHTTSKTPSSITSTLFLAFPDSAPYVYISLASSSSSTAPTSTTETRPLRKAIIDAVPKALSRPHERYKLEPTSLNTKSLPALLQMRGQEGTNCAQGGWGIFVDGEGCGSGVGGGVLDYRREEERKADRRRKREMEGEDDGEDGEEKENAEGGEARQKGSLFGPQESPGVKRRKLIAEGRFGQSGLPDDGKGIERLDIRLDDSFPSVPAMVGGDVEIATKARRALAQETNSNVSAKKGSRKSRSSLLDKPANEENPEQESIEDDEEWIPDVRLSFQGTHVFAGLRQLVEEGIIDGKRMPGWMTGEASVSIGVVRDGRIRMKPERIV
ncbi:MAG: hypothetical protein M1821_006208 [Bathelium mastoideum]|nr:MAG: hypothetical protein M1821_006208 [Bathelium mastoideum]KAI9686547.1 MAG: hypothetical protein M1822_003558 [Bathelium mastoideum]